MKHYIKEKIIIFLKNNDYPDIFFETVEVLTSKNRKFGDYNSNICLKLASREGGSPLEIAEKIKEYFLEKYSEDFSKITISEPGFINFFLSEKLLTKKLKAFSKQKYLPEFKFKKKKINYEFVSANPTGHLHIGHARNAILGDSYIRLLEYLENDVVREYYINDAGSQINNLANSVWYYYQKALDPQQTLDKSTVSYRGQEIIDYANYLAKTKMKVNYERLGEMAKKHFLSEIKTTLKKLNIKPFHTFTSEQWLIDSGRVEEMLEKLKKSKYAYFKDGAWWIKTLSFGDDKNRVLIKSDGSFTYMVPDVANHIYKYERGFDWMINLWGADHHGYEKRIKSGLEILGYDSKKLDVDYISMVKIIENEREVKMSKRLGNALTINRILQLIDANILKFYILSKTKEQQLSIKIAKIQEKGMNNPYWYVQYVNARIKSLFEKYNFDNKSKKNFNFNEIFKQKNKAEMDLIFKLLEYDDAIWSAYLSRDTSSILNFIRELASKFHTYYGVNRIIDQNNLQLTKERIAFLQIFLNIYHNLFAIIGIDVIDNM